MKQLVQLSLSLCLTLVISTGLMAQTSDQMPLIESTLQLKAEEWNLSSLDFSDITITDNYYSKSTKATHVYVGQRYNGILIENAISNFNFKDGKFISIADKFKKTTNDDEL